MMRNVHVGGVVLGLGLGLGWVWAPLGFKYLRLGEHHGCLGVLAAVLGAGPALKGGLLLLISCFCTCS